MTICTHTRLVRVLDGLALWARCSWWTEATTNERHAKVEDLHWPHRVNGTVANPISDSLFERVMAEGENPCERIIEQVEATLSAEGIDFDQPLPEALRAGVG